MRGLGTLLNVATVLAGSSVGVLLGGRLPGRIREVVTDGIGLLVLMVAVLDGASVLDPALRRAVGSAAPVLIVLGSVLLGGIAGSALRVEDRLDQIGAALQLRLHRSAPPTSAPPAVSVPPASQAGVVPPTAQAAALPAPPAAPASQAAPAAPAAAAPAAPAAPAGPAAAPASQAAPEVGERERFIQGFVTASIIYCVGPLTILGSLQDGLGRGFSQLALKSTLDGFTSIALAASLGWGVAASAVSVLVIQGTLTVAAAGLGTVMTDAEIAAMTATGGLLLAGLAFSLLRLRQFPVADLLPALIAAPLLTELVAVLR